MKQGQALDYVGRLKVLMAPASAELSYGAQGATESAGTVIFVKKSGPDLIGITCNHVVNNAHDLGITMTLNNDAKPTAVQVLKTNAQGDFAMLKMQPDEDVMRRVRTIDWGEARGLRPMQDVSAEGFTMGWPTKDQYGQEHGMPLKYVCRNHTNNLLQLKGIGLNPGMSGGAVTADGKLIGMVRNRPTESENIAFATPSEHLRALVDDEVFDGKIVPDRTLGFVTSRNCEDFNRYHGLQDLTSGGVIAQQTHLTEGLDEGDVVLAIEDPHSGKMAPITYQGLAQCNDGLLSISDLVQQYPTNQSVKLSVVTPSDNAKAARVVELPAMQNVTYSDPHDAESFGLYATAMPLSALDPTVRKQLPEKAQEAIVVSDVYGGSHFQTNTPLGRGQVITHVGKDAEGRPQPVLNMSDYRAQLHNPEEVNGQRYLSLHTICSNDGCRGLCVANVDRLMNELPLLQHMRVPHSSVYLHYQQQPTKAKGDSSDDDDDDERPVPDFVHEEEESTRRVEDLEVTEGDDQLSSVAMEDGMEMLRPPAYRSLDLAE